MEKQKCPAIRFKGFDLEWEENILSDITTFINGRAYSQEELLKKGKYPVLRVGNFNTNSHWYYSDLELGAKYYAEEGDLLYTWSTIFSPYIWKGEKVIYHYHIWKVELSKNLDKLFAFHFLKADESALTSNTNGSTMIHVTKGEMESKTIHIPLLDEQEKIGLFFESLNAKINLQEQKLSQTKNIKKLMLEQMFPKAGSKQPEIRLKGFSGDWEISILGERNDVRDGTHASPVYVKKGYPLVTSKNLTENGLDIKDVSFISEYDYKEINKRSKVDSGDILLALIGTIGNPVQVTFGNYAIKNMGLIKNGGNIKNEFLLPYLKSNLFLNYVSQKNTGNTQKFLGLDTLRSFEVLIPIVDEQVEIAKFFKQLDETLVLQQQQLQTLKNLKQAFLEKMFV